MFATRRDVGELGHRFPQGGVVRNFSVRVSDGVSRKSRRRRIALGDRPLLIEPDVFRRPAAGWEWLFVPRVEKRL